MTSLHVKKYCALFSSLLRGLIACAFMLSMTLPQILRAQEVTDASVLGVELSIAKLRLNLKEYVMSHDEAYGLAFDKEATHLSLRLSAMSNDTHLYAIHAIEALKKDLKNYEEYAKQIVALERQNIGIEGSVFSKKEATEISTEQQKEMFELYEINWKNHPDRDFVESLKSYFKTAFSPEDNKHKNYFYTFEKNNNIRAFVRFEEKEKNNLYTSALNVDEASKNFGLGEAMMDEALFKEAQKNVLHASCRKDNPSNMRYFEKGFIANSTKVTNNTEEFDLVWDENKNKNIKAKQKSQEDLIHMYGNTNIEEIEIRKSKELISLHKNIPENKALVRCFLNNGEWFAVYEKIEDGYGVNLSEVR